MRRYCRYLLLLVMLVPQTMMAQFNFDVETVEALIRDHKRIRSVLMVRDGIEQANEVLHQYSKKAVENHYEVNVSLDEFTRFDSQQHDNCHECSHYLYRCQEADQ